MKTREASSSDHLRLIGLKLALIIKHVCVGECHINQYSLMFIGQQGFLLKIGQL